MRFLKRVLIFLYLLLFRRKQRKNSEKVLTNNHRKRRYLNELTELPNVLDEVKELPGGWSDKISFLCCDKDGLCLRFEIKRQRMKKFIEIDLEIPGIGHFYYKDTVKQNNLTGNGKFQIYPLQPMRKWRLCFRGSLKHRNNDRKSVYTNISLFWQCLSDPFDYLNSTSCWKQAETLSELQWKEIGVMSLCKIIWYQQWGEMRGTISIQGLQDLKIRLKSMRERMYSPPNTMHMQPFCRQHLVVEESGHTFSNTYTRINNKTNICFGYMTFPIGDNHSIDTQTFIVRLKKTIPTVFSFPAIIKSCQISYNIVENLSKICFGDSTMSKFQFKTAFVDGKFSYGFQWICQDISDTVSEETNENIYSSNCSKEADDRKLVIELDDPACRQRQLVGGKACQLSILRTLQNLSIPNGFCITACALRKHNNVSDSLVNALRNIEACVTEMQAYKLKQACDTAAEAIRGSTMDDDLKNSISNCLDHTFGKGEWTNKRFAVRSSSLNEDSAEASSAGQMATLLGVQGFVNIIDAIKHCWASSVSFQVIGYRRQNGQNLIESMGVVIQEMVDADVAGVLFTNDATTGDDSKMVLNAAFGLGESVVSGRCMPDYFIVNRDEEDNLKIETAVIGEKSSSIIMKGETGITHVQNSDTQMNKLSLEDEAIFRICRQGIQIEKQLNSAQDIEWAISAGHLYILQTRPVTSLGVDTDEETIHEFDTPVISDSVLLTTANIQEMMPGAVSTLTCDLFLGAIERSLKFHIIERIGVKYPVHASTSVLTISGIPLLNLTPSAVTTMYSIGGEKSKSNVEIFVVGQPVKEHTLHMIKEHFGRQMSAVRRFYYIMLQLLVRDREQSKLFENLRQITDTFSIGEHSPTASDLYEAIDEKLMLYYEMWRAYIYKASESSKWSGIIMAMLKGKSDDMSTENMADMALILSKCNDIYSAEVPTAISNLAKCIALSDFKRKFLNTSIEECDSLLNNASSDNIREEYVRFMERHGHRGIREAEFLEQPWSRNPSELMKTLKMIIEQSQFKGNVRSEREIEDIVESLKTPLSWIQKILLKRFLVRKAMEGVGSRELGKSICIKFSDVFKQAYWRLATLMVCEGRLPDPKLAFFMTHAEIGDLLETRSALLIRQAKRRMKVYPEMMETRLPKISIGLPQVIPKEEKDTGTTAELTLQGMPVCCGKAKGRACVIKSIKDASHIKNGDILICQYTDVGWSPYFSLIRGLVTELGGLLSHGAVVARECGIPCIVNMTDATDVFSTGDTVLIDGTAGTLSKVC